VTTGMDVVDTISNVETGPGDRPQSDVVMESVVLG
jgi:peptidyl-prolyl cis-trans isomerase A (cyclophilin A)